MAFVACVCVAVSARGVEGETLTADFRRSGTFKTGTTRPEPRTAAPVSPINPKVRHDKERIMNVLGVIMARAGSLGLKNKHLLPLLACIAAEVWARTCTKSA